MTLQTMRAQGGVKRIPGSLILGFVALTLVSCAAPGGVYKGYEGPDRDLNEIAVLTWSSPRVSHIDGEFVMEGWLFGGRTVAHLPPGRHEIAISHDWEDLYSWDSSARTVDLMADLLPGHSYEVRDDPCKSCSTFKVDFNIVDIDTEEVIVGVTRFGFGPYGAVKKKKQEKREELEECEWRCEAVPCLYREKEWQERCEEGTERCLERCRDKY